MPKQKQIPEKPHKIRTRWYATKPVIILALIFLLPLGLFLMWKFPSWTKKTKWIVTAILTFFWAFVFIGTYNSPPTITFTNAKDNKISTDVAEYVITGTVSSMKDVRSLTINDKPVTIATDSGFAHKVILEEGDTVFSVVATNENGNSSENVIIHRASKAELEARLAAEKKRLEQQVKEELAKKEAKDAEEKAKAEAQAAKEEAAADKQAAKDQSAADKKAAKEKTAADKQAAKEKAALDKQIAKDKAAKEAKVTKEAKSNCNWWCRLTGGDKKKEVAKESAPEIKKAPVTTPAVPAQPKIGETVTSGNFAFRVNSVNCGETTISWVYGGVIRYYSTALGKFCRLNMTVQNIGDYKDSISIWDQYLYNSKGQQWSYDSGATSNAAKYLYGSPLVESMNPGISITGDIIYDVPSDQSPATVVIDGGLFGSTKTIRL